ncbi:MAG: segregation/condensation protein A [bacterium]|nr:segregation/condensation protein A [bacterium]
MTANSELKTFQIQQEKFAGPLDLLLSLIEEKKLEITEISLAQVTDDFLKHIGDIKQANAGTLADFIVVAAKLLLIKSRALLPTLELSGEEEAEIGDLTKRLEIYKLFKEASQNLKKIYLRQPLFSREFLFNQTPIFYPPQNLSVVDIQKAFQKIWEEFQKLGEEISVEKIKKIVKIEEKIKDILNILNQNSNLMFKNAVKKSEKIDVIVTFLAILHMFKEKMIIIEQKQEFGEISLTLQK